MKVVATILGGCLISFTVGCTTLPSNADQQISNCHTQPANRQVSKQYDNWQSFVEANTVYWQSIAKKRAQRAEKRRNKQSLNLGDFILYQPPQYIGPPIAEKPGTQAPSVAVPTVADFVAASYKIYKFKPEQPANEAIFMRNYAEAAKSVGFTADQLIGIYAFETGGIGEHDLQSGTSKANPNAKPISTAIGYHQLVATASLSVMSEFGPDIAARLTKQAQAASGKRRQDLLHKAEIVKRMTTFARSVPHNWNEQAKLAKTEGGLAIHAMTLDQDIGPLLQVEKLRTSLDFLRRNGVKRVVSASELEMLNLTGDGNGYDMITMPLPYRDIIPTANFFLENGYMRNAIARQNDTVAKLLCASEEVIKTNSQKKGTQQLRKSLSQ